MALQSASQSSTDFGALLQKVGTLSPDVQRDIAAAAALFRGSDNTLANQVSEIIGNPQPNLGVQGNDALAASPTTFGVANDIAIERAAQAEGRSSYSEHDLALLKSRVESRVKELMAQGKTLDEIKSEVGGLAAGNAELSSLAQTMAAEQYEANKNPLELPKGQQAEAATSFSLGSLLGLAANETQTTAALVEPSAIEKLNMTMWAPIGTPTTVETEKAPEAAVNPFAAALSGFNIASFQAALSGPQDHGAEPSGAQLNNKTAQRTVDTGIASV